MGIPASSTKRPHYFLHRTFLNENDLLIMFNTKRCRYSCSFCELPLKSSSQLIPAEDILAQFEYIVEELKHSLSILDRITLSNEGSVLDLDTFPKPALLTLASCISELRRIRTLVLETRIEFVDPILLSQISHLAPRATIDILVGFETLDNRIRDDILGMSEPINVFLDGLDRVSQSGSTLTCYVICKPDPAFTDEEAFLEAERSIDFLRYQCAQRRIPLTIRLNPMYMTKGSLWAEHAKSISAYQPPRLTDVMRLAEKKVNEGMSVYIGLSTEGLDEPGGSYRCREDYAYKLIKPIKLFNDKRISRFDWERLA